MKNLGKFAVLGAALAVSASFAHATPITVDSNSGTVQLTGVPGGSGISLGAAFNLTTGLSPWIGPIGTSTWVGPEANTSPGGGTIAPNGAYTYTVTFADSFGANSLGSIQVLADDTTSVVLNGNTIVADAASVEASACTQSTPNCATISTYTLPTADFISGPTQTLTFVVNQDWLSGTGLDFEATINQAPPVPEPSSLMLLGTGLIGAAGMLYRRQRQIA